MLRKAVVKDVFYSGQPNVLTDFISTHRSAETLPAKGVVCPHAGYLYSGKTAVQTLSTVFIPDRVILLGPNHTGLGDTVAVSADTEWETPFGNIEVDSSMVDSVMSQIGFSLDSSAHMKEHSLEVILPILKFLNPNVRMLPICIQQLSLNDCYQIANGICQVMKQYPESLLIASSDMNHFEAADISKKKDQLAIDAILKMDPDSLYHTVMDNRISMCGVFPTVIMLMTLNQMGQHQADLISYSHSGEVNGDTERVVGYAGISIN